MGYWLRAFCGSERCPTIDNLCTALRERGRAVQILIPKTTGGHDPDWSQCLIKYDPERLPIIIDINRANDPNDDTVEEEIKEFFEFLEDAAEGPAKSRVIGHLKKTRFIIAAQIPTADIVDAGYEATDTLFQWLIDEYEALSQADYEGFYDENGLILELE
ncbi:MAG: hypothetical protein ACF8PN_04790 [Phycisphaerales bacterium]